MSIKRVPTIRSRLILLVMACIIPASAMIAGLISHDYYQSRAALIQSSLATARAVMSVVDRDFAGTESMLLALATSPALVKNDLSSFYVQAGEVLKTQNASSIFLLDATFQQILNTLVPLGSTPPPRVDTGLRQVFKTGRPFISDIFLSPISNKPLVVVGVPVFRGDAVIYVLGASILPERLSALLAQQNLPADWIGVIFDSTGTIAARTQKIEQFLGTKGAPAVITRAKQVAEDAVETTSIEGIPIISVFSRSAISNWTVAIGIRSSLLINQLWETLGWIVVGTVILLTISIGLTWSIGRKIAGPIHELTAPALALGAGRAVTIPPLSLREADEVGRALTKASKMLVAAQHRGTHDELTGLANRTLFDEILSHQLAICTRTKTNLAIVYIDLNGFKPVNDEYGHATGDEVLSIVAERLKSITRESDLAARLGGDEFALILNHTGMAAAETVAHKLTDTLSAPYTVGFLRIKLSASIGIAVYPESGTTSEALSRRADEAMYKAKALSKQSFALAS